MKQYKILVCGTLYGQVYLSAFLRNSTRFVLAGILGKGSERTIQFAREFGVPVYRAVKEVPDNIDIACVAIRSTIAGGNGSFIAKELLEKKISVIQEHPVHRRDIEELLETAQKNGVYYHVNSHYVNVEPICTFIDYAIKMNAQSVPMYINIVTAPQITYSILDIIGRAVGGIEPFTFTKPIEWEHECKEKHNGHLQPFKCFQGIFCGVPITYNIQNYIDSSQFDNHYLNMHRISIGNESGSLNLMNTNGPVVWTDSFSIGEENETNSFRLRKSAFINYKRPTAVVFTPRLAPSLSSVAKREWPDAIVKVIDNMTKHIETGNAPEGQTQNYLINLSHAWLELTKIVGKTPDVRLREALPPYPDPIEYLNRIEKKQV